MDGTLESTLVCAADLRYSSVYLTPLLGAYIADGYLGRYKTISLAVGIAIVGHIILVVSAVPGVVSNPNGSLACFIIAILVFGECRIRRGDVPRRQHAC